MPPRRSPTGGMIMSLTRDATTVPRAPPMITPIASASALVFSRNARNSPSIGLLQVLAGRASVADDLGQLIGLGDPAGDGRLRWDLADHVRAGRVELLERRREVRGVPPGELRARVDTGR